MPIDKNEFVKGAVAPSYQRRILEFLSKNSDKAYTTVEIVRELFKPAEEFGSSDILAYNTSLLLVSASLDILLEEGKVVGKFVQTGSGMDLHFMVP